MITCGKARGQRANVVDWLLLLPVNVSDDSAQPNPVVEELPQGSSPAAATDSSMQEYYQLKRTLVLVTLTLIGIIFICVWIFYSLDIALNYLLGACTGMVYLRMLARDVEGLSSDNKRLSKARFAVFIGLIIVATRWHDLHVVPIFLGFMTYKATLLVYMVQSFMPPDPKKVK
ncbi:MAG TPA: ATP synthase subunit I [Waterburya sp.]|jgi:ATP synthase protein I